MTLLLEAFCSRSRLWCFVIFIFSIYFGFWSQMCQRLRRYPDSQARIFLSSQFFSLFVLIHKVVLIHRLKIKTVRKPEGMKNKIKSWQSCTFLVSFYQFSNKRKAVSVELGCFFIGSSQDKCMFLCSLGAHSLSYYWFLLLLKDTITVANSRCPCVCRCVYGRKYSDHSKEGTGWPCDFPWLKFFKFPSKKRKISNSSGWHLKHFIIWPIDSFPASWKIVHSYNDYLCI